MTAIFEVPRSFLRAMGLMKSSPNVTSGMTSATHVAGPSVKTDAASYPYRRRDDFLSPAERNFLHVLQQTVGANMLICPKVNLADLFYVPSQDSSQYRLYTNKIERKHVDFVLCNPTTCAPVVGIELDDQADIEVDGRIDSGVHRGDERQLRPYFVANVFAATGMPLVRVPAQLGYGVRELSIILQPYLQSTHSQ